MWEEILVKILKTNKYIILLMLAMIILGVKAFLGFGWDDEGYYLSIVHRFYLGEIPMYDEWYPSQLSGVLLLPVYALYKSVIESGDGIVLFFRLFYLFLLFVNSIIVYTIIKKATKHELAAFLGAVFLLIYSTENKALYSYSDLAVSFVTISLVLLYAVEINLLKRKIWYLLSGVCFVCALFANPYLIVIYLYIIVVLIIKWRKNRNKSVWFDFALFTIGCCIIGFSFLGYLLMNASLGELMDVFHYFMNFPGHAAKNILVDIVKWCWYVLKPYSIPVIMVQFCLFGYVFLAQVRRGMRVPKQTIFVLELICAILYIVIQYLFMEDKNVIGIAYIPMAILALMSFVLSEKKRWNIFFVIYVPGILMSIAYQCSSDTGIFAITTGFVVTMIASVVFIIDFINEKKQVLVYRTVIAFVGVVVLYTLFVRISYCRFNAYEEVYNSQIQNGPYKWIITDARQKEYYDKTLIDMEEIEDKLEDNDTVLILGNNMWMYLCLEHRVGAPTTWRMTIDHEYFKPYFAMHPDKLPKIIYANEQAKEYWEDCLVLEVEEYVSVYAEEGKIYSR